MNCGVTLKANKAGGIVFGGETAERMSFVLKYPFFQNTCYANVKHTPLAAHDVNVVMPF